ncbi:MAG: hypothetical protein K9I68_00430 [Bacteroidales bacterium]|nr:hypothetical protein [Bacteroidales bacterium]MCF8336444.1 hypothetical protein [Bacteroidales bacterium]
MSNPDLGHIQIVEPHELWKNEARDFTPWLAENAQQLSEAIGIPIEIDSTEKSVLNDENYKKELFDTKKAPDYSEALIS